MSESADDTRESALREAARSPEFWREQITRRIPADPDVDAQELMSTFETVYRRRIAEEIAGRGMASAEDVAAALRAGDLGRLRDPG